MNGYRGVNDDFSDLVFSHPLAPSAALPETMFRSNPLIAPRRQERKENIDLPYDALAWRPLRLRARFVFIRSIFFIAPRLGFARGNLLIRFCNRAKSANKISSYFSELGVLCGFARVAPTSTDRMRGFGRRHSIAVPRSAPDRLEAPKNRRRQLLHVGSLHFDSQDH
jgi:hypothetical protein